MSLRSTPIAANLLAVIVGTRFFVIHSVRTHGLHARCLHEVSRAVHSRAAAIAQDVADPLRASKRSRVTHNTPVAFGNTFALLDPRVSIRYV